MSCTHFQCAAWAFQHLRDNFDANSSPDMNYSLLTFQSNIMLVHYFISCSGVVFVMDLIFCMFSVMMLSELFVKLSHVLLHIVVLVLLDE